MSDQSRDAVEKTARGLQNAIRDIRLQDMERSDVIVELRDTERARLELLQHALEDVIAELPDHSEQFSLAIAVGEKPRFWVDVTSFVMLGRDKRTYRFLKDTRLGRVVLAEDENVDVIADKVTNYLAERIIEREKFLEGDRVFDDITAARYRMEEPESEFHSAKNKGFAIGNELRFLGGVLVGAVGIVLIAWFTNVIN